MKEATAETLREVVVTPVDDPEVARGLKEIQHEMAREGGTRTAADLIKRRHSVTVREPPVPHASRLHGNGEAMAHLG